MANKVGRPRLPEGAARHHLLTCRLLPGEQQEIKEAARLAGKSKSDWIRQTLLSAAHAALPRPAGIDTPGFIHGSDTFID